MVAEVSNAGKQVGTFLGVGRASHAMVNLGPGVLRSGPWAPA
jgi:hypothetical protein